MAKKKTTKAKKAGKKAAKPETTEIKGVFVNYRQSRHTIHPKHAIIKVNGIDTRKTAYSLIGKTASWTSPSGKTLSGKITRVHGKNGLVVGLFKAAGLPGQAMGQPIKIQ